MQLRARRPLSFVEGTHGCVICTSRAPGKDGYVRVPLEGGRGGRMAPLHRLIWEARNGPIPGGYEAHHICENRACVNPWHIHVMPKEDHVRHHALKPQRDALVDWWRTYGGTTRELATRFGVSAPTAWRWISNHP